MNCSTLHRRGAVLMLTCALFVGACGGSKDADSKAESSAGADGGRAPVGAAAETRAARLPTANADVPLSDYYELEGAHQLASTYYAIGELPPDMDVLARISSSDYAYTPDAFRKQDLMKALEPQLRAQLEHARTNRYFWTDQRGVCLGHYDMAAGSFPVSGGPTQDSYLYFDNSSEFKLAFTNADAFRHHSVAEETRARELEALVTKGAACGNLRLYVFAQGVDLRSKTVRAQIVKAQLYDYQRRMVTEL